MCPRPQAGSRQVIELRESLDTMTCSMRARVAHGGVGKSSRLFFSSALCAITACDVFCIFHTRRLSDSCSIFVLIRRKCTMDQFVGVRTPARRNPRFPLCLPISPASPVLPPPLPPAASDYRSAHEMGLGSELPCDARSWAWKDWAAANGPLTRMRGTAPVSKARPRSAVEGKSPCEGKIPPVPGQDLPSSWLAKP